MNQDNLILKTDSYKLNHWNQYPHDTEAVYSYFESRSGAQYDETVFVGLQYILKRYLEGVVVTQMDIIEAEKLAAAHFGGEELFNREGWYHILREHGGKLPVRICAVPEGTPVSVGNVLMTVENTCPECYWLTNALESLLTHVWYPSTVASQSRFVKQMLADKLERCGASLDGLQFMLHDFGYRGVSSDESSAVGGLGHLVNFVGSDTLTAMLTAVNYYDAQLDTLAFSVPATEHSIMTSLGESGEMKVVEQLLDEYPNGILSVVADSYNIYDFVDEIGTTYKDRILARDGVFVVRPDSITSRHPTPQLLTAYLLEELWRRFGGTENEKGFKVLDPHVRVLWGDGIDPLGIEKIVDRAMLQGFSPENLVFGMGGGLLQKVNRDTQRFAFKSSAQKRDGVWYDVYKKPLDSSKASKRGKLKLLKIDGRFLTVPSDGGETGLLRPVFENGELLTEQTFEEIRANAALSQLAVA